MLMKKFIKKNLFNILGILVTAGAPPVVYGTYALLPVLF